MLWHTEGSFSGILWNTAVIRQMLHAAAGLPFRLAGRCPCLGLGPGQEGRVDLLETSSPAARAAALALLLLRQWCQKRGPWAEAGRVASRRGQHISLGEERGSRVQETHCFHRTGMVKGDSWKFALASLIQFIAKSARNKQAVAGLCQVPPCIFIRYSSTAGGSWGWAPIVPVSVPVTLCWGPCWWLRSGVQLPAVLWAVQLLSAHTAAGKMPSAFTPWLPPPRETSWDTGSLKAIALLLQHLCLLSAATFTTLVSFLILFL